ncbi:S-layer homology domain-containing protein [Cohnella sp. GCM10020058]|uniref:S-layer homology domain-containing protein n=1 Tax=Cohnella sp. GCM10020058 TaxID=3317330 RepID=UPI00362E9B37
MRTHPALRVLNLIVLGILILTAAIPGGAAYAKPAQQNWLNVSISGVSDNLRGLVYAEDKHLFVAVGDGGAILTSADGENWTKQTLDTTARLSGVAYGDGLFVAVGEGGAVAYSTDGSAWTSGVVADAYLLTSVAYGAGAFVAVGYESDEESASIYEIDKADIDSATTPGDATWTNVTPIGELAYYDVVYENGVFQAAGMLQVSHSADGSTWSAAGATLYNMYSTRDLGDTGQILMLAANFLDDTDNYVTLYNKSDSEESYSRNVGSSLYSMVQYAEGKYMAVGANGSYARFEIAETDGKYDFVGDVDEYYEPDVEADLHKVVYGDSKFIAVGDGGTIIAYKAEELSGLALATGTVAGTTKLSSLPAGTFKYAVGEAGSKTWPIYGKVSTDLQTLTDTTDINVTAGQQLYVARTDADDRIVGWQAIEVDASDIAETVDPGNPSTGLIYNQDGFGYSGQIAPHPLGSVVEMKGYSNWPAGLNRGSFAFSGGIFDGQNVWMIPYQADGVLKINKDSAEMSVYKDWPSGFNKVSTSSAFAFSSGVFDGQSIWMIPYSADRVIKVDKDTGVMTGYNNWPAGTTSIGMTAFSGGVYDGHDIWLIPAAVNKVVKLDPATGAMTGYDSWPAGFNGAGGFRGGLFDGRYVWLIPSSANQVVRFDPATGAMVGYSAWPAGFDKSTNSFSGGVLAGQDLWMFPASGNGTNETLKLNTSSGKMTAYSGWPSDLASLSYTRRFSGGVFDGQSVWMAPSTKQAKNVVKIDKNSGVMTGYSNWPTGLDLGNNPFSGGVFDGKRIWLVPTQANQVVVLQTKSYAVTYAAGAHGSISGDANQSVAHGESSTSVTAIADEGYQFVDWSDGNSQASRSDANITAALSVTANFIEQQGPTQVTLESAVADGASKAATSTKIAFTFDKDIAGLTANDISIADDTGSVVAGSLTGSGRNWSVTLTSVTSEGNVKLSVNSPEGYVVDGSPATVAVYKAAVPAAGLTVTSTDPSGAANDGKTKIVVAEIQPNGYKLVYRNFGTNTVVVPNVGDTLTGYSDLPSGGLIAAANGDKIGVAEVDADGKVLRYGSTTAVSANEPPIVEPPYVNPSAPTESSVEVLVNGKVENAGKATTTEANGVKTTSISIDGAKLQAKLDAEGNGAIVTIPVKSDSSVIIGELTGQMVKHMASRSATLELKTDKASYTLPAQQINIDAMSAQLGTDVKLEDIKIKITIAQTPASMSQVVENSATEGGFSLIVPSTDFTVTGTYNGKTIEISKFNAYVARTIALPDGIDPGKITTGIVVDPDSTVRHVPTKITLIDGKYYAEIHSLTNSTYSIVWHPQTFADVENHWAKDAVNDMGSRFVINGVSDTTFSPNADITRAEFAAIVVRGLGLKLGEGANSFGDVAVDAWYASAIQTAVANGLIAGFEDGTFRPDAKITREQAMAIVAKAMKLTGLAEKAGKVDAASALAEFADSASAGGWSKESIALAAKAGLISGRSGGKLEPKAHVTRAEVATLIERLLKQSDLI